MLEGERATWPKIAMIRSHSKINQALEKSVRVLKTTPAGQEAGVAGDQPLIACTKIFSVSGKSFLNRA